MAGAAQLRTMVCRPIRLQWVRSLAVRPSLRSYQQRLVTATATPRPARFLSTTSAPQAEAFHSQLENAPPSFFAQQSKSPQTLTEKIVQRHAVGLPEGKLIRSGDKFTLRPHRLMTHDNSFAVISKWQGFNATKVHDPKQLVMTLDHDVQNKSEANLKKYRLIEEFANQQGITFFPAGRGIGHQIMVEEGFSWPGTLTVASDSHSNMYGGLGCLGVAVVRTDAAAVYATGRTWWECPPVARVNLTGVLPRGVTGKDVIVALCGLFNSDVLNHCVEFTGSEETMRSLPVDTRLTISNMTTEWGALSGLFPIDATLEGWLRYKATEAAMFPDRSTKERITHERIDDLFANRLTADPNAVYAKQLYLNLSTLSPYVSGPNSVKVATPLHELAAKDIKINKAYLVSCTNSRHSDIQAAASVFREAAKANNDVIPKIADGVKMYIAAASSREQEAAEDSGDWQVLLDAGAEALVSGCGPCIGLGTGLLEPGECGISASNRNFKGRMGSRDALAYLASPEVVAASALSGVISGPGAFEAAEDWPGVDCGFGTGQPRTIESQLDDMLQQMDSLIDRVESAEGASDAAVEILPGFPESVSGEIVFADMDNLDTDQIYPGSMTYKDNVSKEDMAKACMKNYDPDFGNTIKPNDILVSGFNFGCGSSREQAATAILASSVPLVVAGSFSNIFSRNSINNALMGLELPRLVERLRTAFPKDEKNPTPTLRTGWTLKWDVKKSMVEVQEGEGGEKWTEKVGDVPPNVQEILALGGLEEWCKHELKKAGSS